MRTIPDISVEIRVGGSLSSLKTKPLIPFSEPVMAFLSELSKNLLSSQEYRAFPDIAAFAYWCRAGNLARMSREFDARFKRLGRGLALHIAPANVPVNFAFSFAFGLLSGNANIVRMPEAKFLQSEIICDEIARLFSQSTHAQVASMNRFIRYPRNDETTAAISACCQARVIWGGDSTIARLRPLPSPPRCVDITFADRYSLCLLEAGAVLDCSEKTLSELAHGFYNDAYLMDQNACSSPHLVFWVGNAEQVDRAMERFWSAVSNVVQDKYDLQPVQAVDKFVNLCRTAIGLPEAKGFASEGNQVYRVRLSQLPENIENQRGQCGFFYEHAAESYSSLAEIVGDRYQTLTSFGIDAEKIVDFIRDNRLSGIDRVVPVGKALEIGVIWDGYDVVGSLTRIVRAEV
jgi:hypothetical protein